MFSDGSEKVIGVFNDQQMDSDKSYSEDSHSDSTDSSDTSDDSELSDSDCENKSEQLNNINKNKETSYEKSIESSGTKVECAGKT